MGNDWSRRIGKDENGNFVSALDVTPSGQVLACFGGFVCELLPSERRPVAKHDAVWMASFVAAHPTSGAVVVGGSAGEASVLQIFEHDTSRRVELEIPAPKWGAFSRDGATFVCGGSHQVVVQRWGSTDWSATRLRGSDAGAISLDGTQVARIDSDEGVLCVLDVAAKSVSSFPTEAWGNLFATADGWVARSRRGNITAIDREGNTLWEQRIAGEGAAAACTRGGRSFAAVVDGSVFVFDARTGAKLAQHKRSRATVRCCAFASDGTLLVGTDDGLEAYGGTTAKAEKPKSRPIKKPTDSAAAWALIESLERDVKLARGASATAVKRARVIGTVPKELQELLARHNGDESSGLFFGWSLMSLSEIAEEQAFWEGYAEERGDTAAPKARGVKDGWWQPGWFPFAKSGGGDFIFLDTAPAKGGVSGQLFVQTMDPPSRTVVSHSLEEWFCRFAIMLASGEQRIERLLARG